MFQRTSRHQRGFTIIEVTIAMTFIAVLLITIILIGNQIIELYNKGLTIKDVNAVSRQVTRDLQVSVADGKTMRLKTTSGDYATDLASANPSGADPLHYYSNAYGGRLCTGSYSYAWNYPNDDPTAPSQVLPGPSSERITFVKTPDTERRLCAKDAPAPSAVINGGDGRVLPSWGTYQKVLSSGSGKLQVYSMKIESPESMNAFLTGDAFSGVEAVSTFYHITIMLGTKTGGERTNSIAGVGCDIPKNSTQEFAVAYCAVNEIDFVARTGMN